MPVRHIAYGNINIDFYLYVERLPAPDEEIPVEDAVIGPGGAASNYAVAAVKAGHEAMLVAHTTRDAEALGVLDKLRNAGVDVSHVTIHEDGMPGMVVIVVSSNGETVMFKVRGVNALLTGGEVKGVSVDVAHVASADPSVVDNVLANVSARVYSYDPGGAVALRQPSRVASLAGRVTVLSLNAREFLHVFGLSIARLVAQLPRGSMILVRLGARGSLLVSPHGVLYAKSWSAGRVVDTTGAGDVFNAYFNAWLAEGASVEDALVAATVAAGIKVTRRGAQSAPARHEVEEYIPKAGIRVEKLETSEAEDMLRSVVGV